MPKLSRLLRTLSLSFLILFCLCEITLGQTGIYSIVDIAPGTVANPDISYYPKKINDNGYITGFKSSSPGSFVSQYWVGGFEFPAGNSLSVAYDISNGNLIVGRGNFGVVDNRAYSYRPSALINWLPCPVFNPFVGPFCEAYAVNNNALIVGTSDLRSLYPQNPSSSSRALLWNSGTATEIFPGSSFISVANDINNSDTIVGMRDYQPFIKSSTGGLLILSSNTGSVGQMIFATAINDSGNVVGGHTLNEDGLAQRAFFWNGVSPVDIGTLGISTIPPGSRTPVVAANDINNGDQVVGNAVVGFAQNGSRITHAFIWDAQNGMRDLNNLLPPNSGIILTQATGINNRGDIAAVGYQVGNNPGIQRAYRLKLPVEPVIFIPGTMGSELYRKNSDGTIGSKYWMRIFDSHLYNSYLTLDPDSFFYVQDGFVAKDVIRTVTYGGFNITGPDGIPVSAPPVSAGEVYDPILNAVKNRGSFREYDISQIPPTEGCDTSQINTSNPDLNPNLFVFPYDWRRDNAAVSAVKLRDYVNCVRQFYPNKNIKILSHSQGGLVGSRYIFQNPGITISVNLSQSQRLF